MQSSGGKKLNRCSCVSSTNTSVMDYSFGLFFSKSDLSGGVLLPLRNGHNHGDRLEAATRAGVDFDFCALYYSNNQDGSNRVPFNFEPSNPVTMVIDRDSVVWFEMNMETSEILSLAKIACDRETSVERIVQHTQYERAKNWFDVDGGALRFSFVDDGQNTLLKVCYTKNQVTSCAEGEDVIQVMIELKDQIAWQP